MKGIKSTLAVIKGYPAFCFSPLRL